MGGWGSIVTFPSLGKNSQKLSCDVFLPLLHTVQQDKDTKCMPCPRGHFSVECLCFSVACIEHVGWLDSNKGILMLDLKSFWGGRKTARTTTAELRQVKIKKVSELQDGEMQEYFTTESITLHKCRSHDELPLWTSSFFVFPF